MPSTYKNGVWIGEEVPLPDDWPRFRNLLLKRLQKFPNRLSQIDAANDRQETYGQLADKVIRCATWLKKQHLQVDDVVCICSYRHLDTIVPFVASILSGVIVHPWWEATLTDDMIKHFFYLTNPKIIFADETKVDKIEQVANEIHASVKIIAFKDTSDFETLSDIMKLETTSEVGKFECEDLYDDQQPALILCTSGTTGYPKGTLLSYGWLMNTLLPITESFTNHYWPAGINWVSGVMNTLRTILSCSTAIIHPTPNAEVILEIIQKYKIVGIRSLNTAYAMRMWSSDMVKNYDVSSMEYLMTTGSAMHPEVDEYMAKSFKNARAMTIYGCTEVTLMCVRPSWTGKPTSCGFIGKNVQLKVIDLNNGGTLGFNQEGEICAKFSYRMLGYYKNPKATKAVFDDDGWYHTGDIGYYDKDGEFFIVDRLKDLIKFRMNFHFPPSIVEKVIMKCPGVFEVAVVAKPHVEDIEQPMAFVSLYPNSQTIEQDIVDHVAHNLPDHMHLRGGVVIVDELPHTESGKISKKELKKLIALNPEK